MQPSLSDIEVVEKLKKGEKKIYSLLVDRYKDYCVTLAYRVVKDEDEAEEVAQLAFIKAYRSIQSFKGEAKFSSWLYRIVYNTAISELRKQKNMEEFKIHKFDKNHADLSSSLEEEDRKKYIDQALKRLNEIDASIISLFYLKEKNLEEISDIIKMKAGNVKVRLHRARKKLAGELQILLQEESLHL